MVSDRSVSLTGFITGLPVRDVDRGTVGFASLIGLQGYCQGINFDRFLIVAKVALEAEA